MLLRRLALTFTLSLSACASPPVPPTAIPDTIPPPDRADGRGGGPPPQANNVVAGDGPPTASVKVAAPASPTRSATASFQRSFEAKRLVPVPILLWPPEQVGGGAVWKSPTGCVPFGVYKDRVACGTCTSYAVTVAVLDAATGNARWALRMDGMKDDPRCLLSDDGKIVVTHRVESASNGFEPRELIVLDSKDGSLLGAYGVRGDQLRVSQRGVVFLQHDYDKPSQIITFDWRGSGRMIAEHKPDDRAWIELRGGDPWVIHKSRQRAEGVTEDHFRWDGALVASTEADSGAPRCKGFPTYAEQSGKTYCIDQKGDRIVYQLEEGGPVIEHVGAQGLLLDDGDIIRAHAGYVARHKPVRIDKGVVKKLN